MRDQLGEAFDAGAVRRVNLLMLAFAPHFPAFERLRSTRLLASFLRNVCYAPFTPLFYYNYADDADAP